MFGQGHPRSLRPGVRWKALGRQVELRFQGPLPGLPFHGVRRARRMPVVRVQWDGDLRLLPLHGTPQGARLILELPDPPPVWVALWLLATAREAVGSTPPLVFSPWIDRLGGILDMHAHLGRLDRTHYTREILGELLDEGHVRRALVSNLDGARGRQVDVNDALRGLVGDDPRMRPVFWVVPEEGLDPRSLGLLRSGDFPGLKFHPVLNRYRADDPRVLPYLEEAAASDLFCLFHTGRGMDCNPSSIAALARAFPTVRFLMGHTGGPGAHREALELLSDPEVPNLFGDTAWFSDPPLLEAALLGPARSRLVFGSDAPVDGESSYDQYMLLFRHLGISREILEEVVSTNPARFLGMAPG